MIYHPQLNDVAAKMFIEKMSSFAYPLPLHDHIFQMDYLYMCDSYIITFFFSFGLFVHVRQNNFETPWQLTGI
jgi:hypothetical protein